MARISACGPRKSPEGPKVSVHLRKRPVANLPHSFAGDADQLWLRRRDMREKNI